MLRYQCEINTRVQYMVMISLYIVYVRASVVYFAVGLENKKALLENVQVCFKFMGVYVILCTVR